MQFMLLTNSKMKKKKSDAEYLASIVLWSFISYPIKDAKKWKSKKARKEKHEKSLR